MKNIRILLTALTIFVGFTISSACYAQMGGKASYYSNGLHGRRMSNGERYNRDSLTCAHRTLPFGTRLRVTNPQNGKSVVVRVTDRGPFVRGRIIDLSYAAARKLGTISKGVAYIKIEVLPRSTEVPYASEPVRVEMPEVEYGMAGVCYEFIPDWEKSTEEDQPKQIVRKVDTRRKAVPATTGSKPATASANASAVAGKSSPVASRKERARATKPQQPQQAHSRPQQPHAKAQQPARPPEEKKTNSWSDFFRRVKDGVTGLFD